MVNILVIGATGYIGKALCQSLVQSGDHRVHGLARTLDKAKSLIRDEVVPIIGSISETAELSKAIVDNQIDTVVDLSGTSNGTYVLLSMLKEIAGTRLQAATQANVRISKLGFIYCSGTWVHGSSNSQVNDLMPVGVLAPTPPAKITSWRPQLEQEIISSSNILNVMVIRPCLVYGRSSAIWSTLFQPIYQAVQNEAAEAIVAAEPPSRPGLVHVDDVASGFHAAIDKLPLVSDSGVYPIFDLFTSQESMRDILETVAKELGFKGTVKLAGCGDDNFAEAMSTSGNCNSGRAKQILGWQPKKYGFVQGMDIYVKAWVANL
jgi:nucleoside-diphosphate-sugar epimerase